MKVNFKQPLVNLEGAPIKEGESNIDFGSVCCAALFSVKGLDPQRAYQLAVQIHTGECELDAFSFPLLERALRDVELPVIVKGQALSMLYAAKD